MFHSNDEAAAAVGMRSTSNLMNMFNLLGRTQALRMSAIHSN